MGTDVTAALTKGSSSAALCPCTGLTAGQAAEMKNRARFNVDGGFGVAFLSTQSSTVRKLGNVGFGISLAQLLST